ncbi:MAG TPA: deoxyribodipyrimidine photo-lyase [Burkholderiaceae bacterium]|nr:deoxyribodipyrimidine photo-lyase [Burkholderiaceae bacterium]
MDSALVWFRRDLRVTDNAALYHALRAARRVYCTFVFDSSILDPLRKNGPAADRRVEFIHRSVAALGERLRAAGGALECRSAAAIEEIPRLARELAADAVFANRDYEPAALRRDAEVGAALERDGRAFHLFKDQVVFEHDEIRTAANQPFSVFTPYKAAWLKKLTPFYLKAYPVERYLGALAGAAAPPSMASLESLGFLPTNLADLKLGYGEEGGRQVFEDFCARIDAYATARDFPAVRGPSYLSVHLRFGTVSVRELARFAWERSQRSPPGAENGAGAWLSELIWRDFYQMILREHPHVTLGAFRREYNSIAWEENTDAFAAWCEGRTGYPLVDAAMAQINSTGYMHNRLRMVTASFLTKDLGIDWRRGEDYFARHLNDYDLAANNGGWQWAASTGCDAQPYFRIFNPVTQSERFDPEGKFIRRYLPQLERFTAAEIHAPWRVPEERQHAAGCRIGTDYPAPIVDHATARLRTLERYGKAKTR